MSTSSVTNTSTSSSGSSYSLGSMGGSTQITGLASGLNTDQIIQEEMAIYRQPVTNLQNQQSGLNAQNKQLASLQTELQTLESNAMALSSPSLFSNVQSVSSSDSTRITAASTTGATGAGVGGYQVSVTQLANSSRQTFSYTSPTSPDTITFDNGQQVTIPAGQSISDFVSSVNSNSNLDVYAAATDSGHVVFSSRATGATGTNFTVTDGNTGSPSLVAQGAQIPGKDAQFSVDGVSGSASSNTVTNAIAGVTLTLTGVTTTSGPVTVNVGAPAPSTTNITSAVNTFITQYNKTISDIQTQLTTPPSKSDPTVGTLYGDASLQGLLGSMRSMMYKALGSPGASIQSMLDIGLSTGATTGGSAPAQSALNGNLQLNATTLASALQSNSTGVQQMMVSFGMQFGTLVGGEADPGGTIDTRIQGDSMQVTQLGNQISAMQSALTDKQNFLVQEFAQLEGALSSGQSQSAWLTSQIAALPGA